MAVVGVDAVVAEDAVDAIRLNRILVFHTKSHNVLVEEYNMFRMHARLKTPVDEKTQESNHIGIEYQNYRNKLYFFVVLLTLSTSERRLTTFQHFQSLL